MLDITTSGGILYLTVTDKPNEGAAKMKFAGYEDNEESKFLQGQVKWAQDKLAEENILYPSGKWSHECAFEVLNDAEDRLLEFMLFRA